jgi:heme/copper-type cytochrome/quinol oxidase subunit 2
MPQFDFYSFSGQNFFFYFFLNVFTFFIIINLNFSFFFNIFLKDSLMQIYIVFINNLLITTCDSAERWQTGIQDPATPMLLEGMLPFYNELMLYIVFIGIAVIRLLYVILTNFREENYQNTPVIPYSSLWEACSASPSLPRRPEHPLIISIIASKSSWVCEYSYESPKAPPIKKRVSLYSGELFLPYETKVRIVFSSADDVGHLFVIPGLNLRLHAPAGGSTETTITLPKGSGSSDSYRHPVTAYKGDCTTKPTGTFITSWEVLLIWFLSPNHK